MSGLKPLLISILVGGLIVLAMINFGIMLSSSNNANHSIGDDPILENYKESLEESLGNAEDNANSSLENLGGSGITESPIGYIYDAITGIWETLKEVPSSIYNATIGLLKTKVFGETFNPLFGIGAAILIILIIFGAIKLILSGTDE